MKLFELPVECIIVKASSRTDFGDIDALAASIEMVGLLHPIVVNSDNELVVGERRLRAVKSLKWKLISTHVANDLDDALLAVQAQRDENTCRKDFTPSEAVAVGKRIEEAYRPKAEKAMAEGQKAGGNTGGRGRQNSSGQNLPRAIRDDSKRTAAVASAAAGISRESYRKAKAVVEAAKENPTVFGPIVEEMDKTGKVDPAFKKLWHTDTTEPSDKPTPQQPPVQPQPKKNKLTKKRLQSLIDSIKELKRCADKPTLQVSMIDVRQRIDGLLHEVELLASVN